MQVNLRINGAWRTSWSISVSSRQFFGCCFSGDYSRSWISNMWLWDLSWMNQTLSLVEWMFMTDSSYLWKLLGERWRLFFLLYPQSQSQETHSKNKILPFRTCHVLLRKFSVNVIYFLFCVLVSGPPFLIYNTRSFGLALKFLLKILWFIWKKRGQRLWSQMFTGWFQI